VSIASGREAAKYFLSRKSRPGAVFAAEDFTALGVIKELKNNHINIPEEFGVFGFANESFGEHISPTLSTIDQQTVLMGTEAFKLLLHFIEEKNVLVSTQKKVVLEPIPIFRESSLK
jgi:LacI family transcriptional regulator